MQLNVIYSYETEGTMDIRAVAAQAIKFVEKQDQSFIGYREALALVGYFQGVVDGRITVGQALVADLILRKGAPWDTRTTQGSHSLTKENQQLIKDIFSSGMTCEGQPLAGLETERESWVVRR